MSTDTKNLKGIKKIGQSLFRVSVKEYSRTDKAIVKQRTRNVSGSLADATKVLRGLKEEAWREVVRLEQLGSIWGQLVDDWEAGITTGKIFTSRNIGPRTIEDYVQACRKYTKAWWRRPAAEVTGADVKRLFYEITNEHNRSIVVQQKLKAAINSIYEWAIEAGRVRGRKNVLPHPTDWTRRTQAKVLQTFLAKIGLPQIHF